MLFDFLNDLDNYDDRKVDRFESDEGNLLIDTCKVSDGKQDYETGIAHDDYNDGKFIIVEAYDSAKDAQVGHNKWVKIMTKGELPDELIDCGNSEISELCGAFGYEMVYKKNQV
jgi:hypothetical protein